MQQSKFVVAVAALLICTGSLARADCPDDICDCVGAAGEFSMVAQQAKVRNGSEGASGEVYRIPSYVETSMCAAIAKVGGKLNGETQIGEDAIFSTASGVAVKFSGTKMYGYPYPGAFISGDVATAGGEVKGEEFAEIDGIVDTTGNHPLVPDCTQALTDLAAGSATLAALPSTQTLGDLIISDGSSYDINVGSGETSVIEIGKLLIKPLKMDGDLYPSYLNINLDGTNSVIINVTSKLAIGSACQIIVNGGDVEDVIINVPGTGSSVRVAREAYVQAPILAPQRKIVASAYSYCSNLFAGKLIVKGATLSETMFCP